MAIYQNDQVMRDRFDNLFDLLSLAAVARRGEEAYAKYANLSQARRTLMIDFGHLFCLSTRAGAVTTESPTEEFELRKLTDESPNDNEISLSSVDPVNW